MDLILNLLVQKSSLETIQSWDIEVFLVYYASIFSVLLHEILSQQIGLEKI